MTDVADHYPDFPSHVKKLASQLAEKHTVNRTDKFILQRQLSEHKAEIACHSVAMGAEASLLHVGIQDNMKVG
jgi:hypothetical protein